MLALVALLVIGVAQSQRQRDRTSEALSAASYARNYNRYALDLARTRLTQLLAQGNPATVRGEALGHAAPHPSWTTLITAPGAQPRWLVSGSPQSPSGRITLHSAGSLEAPLVELRDAQGRLIGHSAYILSDLSHEADLLALLQSPAAEQTLQQQLALGPNPRTFLPAFDAPALAPRTLGELRFANGVTPEQLRELLGRVTGQSESRLLTPSGIRRLNASLDPRLQPLFSPFDNGSDPPEARVSLPSSGPPYRAVAPIVTELKLYCGIFHKRFPGQGQYLTRLRYHLEIEFWNPYPVRLVFDDDPALGRGLILWVEGLPRLTVSIRPPPGDLSNRRIERIEADLDHFLVPLDDNSPDETQVNAWIEFPRDPQGRGYLEPGACFRAAMPVHQDTISSEDDRGLARTLSATKWFWAPANQPPTIPGETVGDNWFGPADDVFLILDHPPFSHAAQRPDPHVSIHLLPFASDPESGTRGIPRDTTPADYAARHGIVQSFVNIQAPGDLRIALPAEDFSIPNSTDYDRSMYQFGYYIKLRDDPASLAALSERHDPRAPVVDLANPEVAAAYLGVSNPVIAPNYIATTLPAKPRVPAFDAGDTFHAAVANQADTAPPRVLFDLPLGPSPTLDPLRHAVWPEALHPFGGATPHKANAYLDSHYAASPHPRLHSARLRAPLNLNTLDPMVWQSHLARDISAWHYDGGRQFTDLRNALFRRPASAHLDSYFLADSDAPPSPDSDDAKRYLWQGLRSLTDEALTSFCKALAARIADHIEAHGPFFSLQQFAESGVVFAAIEESDLNAPVRAAGGDAFHPAWIAQHDILAALAPVLVSHGETYSLRTYGEALHPESGQRLAQAWSEATLHYDGNEAHVVSVRWLQPDEL